MSVVINVSGLSKQYRIGRKEEQSQTFAHAVVNTLAAPFRNYKRIRNLGRGGVADDIFWALKEVSFDVEEGQVVGIIGRNGAGKSTLLKILSRITEPSNGEVRIKGRIASLLEVGTGFHPELSGRENVYMNGTILGMTRREIDRKFDEIVDFSGVEKFIDTAVKFYSSGMKVRLGFAVAAHLEAEILIVDEVLAVGDAEFQKKAIGKMKSVTNRQGRTVLFVSHNIAAIKSLCTNGVLLVQGELTNVGDIDTVVSKYHGILNEGVDFNSHRARYVSEQSISSNFNILEAELLNQNNQLQTSFVTTDTVKIRIKYEILKELKGSVINFSLGTLEQVIFLSFDTDLNTSSLEVRTPGVYQAVVQLPKGIIKPGTYYISLNTGIANFEIYCRLENCLSFSMHLATENESFISYAEKRAGLVAMPLYWETKKIG